MVDRCNKISLEILSNFCCQSWGLSHALSFWRVNEEQEKYQPLPKQQNKYNKTHVYVYDPSTRASDPYWFSPKNLLGNTISLAWESSQIQGQQVYKIEWHWTGGLYINSPNNAIIIREILPTYPTSRFALFDSSLQGVIQWPQNVEAAQKKQKTHR